MQILLTFCCLLFSMSVSAMGSFCYNYDTVNAHPDDILNKQFIKCKFEGDTLYLDGAIHAELIFEIRNFAPQPIRTLYLNSPGGRVKDAFEVAQFIYDNNITTVVRKGARCMSACTLLFQAGRTRIAHPEAHFMYHSARYNRESQSIKDEVKACLEAPNPSCEALISKKISELREITDQLFDLYETYGADPSLYKDYKARPDEVDWIADGNYLKTEDWFMDPEEAQTYNIVQSVTTSLPNVFNY